MLCHILLPLINDRHKEQKQFANKNTILISNGELIPHDDVIELYGPFISKHDAREWLS